MASLQDLIKKAQQSRLGKAIGNLSSNFNNNRLRLHRIELTLLDQFNKLHEHLKAV
jgi:hypothetical protein